MIFIILLIILVVILVIYNVTISKYKEFIEQHSIAIKEIKYINEKYLFRKIDYISFHESFDNNNYYDKLSPEDLLIYELINHKKQIKDNISNVIYNSNQYDLYKYDVSKIKKFGFFNSEENFRFKKLLENIEKDMFKSLIKKPTVSYNIDVVISLTNINMKVLNNKSASFNMLYIEHLLEQIEDKTNERYNNKYIWDAICRIERAKVTNSLRFAIYKRDGYRCCKCGRKTEDLEIDHILPISKGGKTHPNNLQTLCKRCNKNKSNIIEPRTVVFNDKINKFCPCCGAPLKKVNGKYGTFYGCMNFPDCKYKE